MTAATQEKILATNRSAFHNYHISAKFEAGAALLGTEVKSVLDGRIQLKESYVGVRDGEAWLNGLEIATYDQGNRANHEPMRARKLLLHRRQIDKLAAAVDREGMTIIPLKMFFNDKGRAKIEIALGRGKKLHDKRESEKKRSWERERGRLMRLKG